MDKQTEETMNKARQGINSIIIKSRKKLLCPICSEVIQHSLEIGCRHKFCEGCITAYTAKKTRVKCPVCNHFIKKQAPYAKDSYGDALGKFISFLTNAGDKSDDSHNIKRSEGPSIQPAGSPKQKKKRKEKNCKDLKNRQLNNSQSMKDVENTLPTVEPASKKRKLDDDKPSDPPTMKKPTRTADRIKNFQDSKNRQLVLEWLHASQNEFNQLTHTQICSDEVNLLSLSQLSEPSVSQRTRSQSNLASKRTHSRSLDNRDRNLDRRRSDVLGVINNYDIEDAVLKKHQLRESECMNELEEQFQEFKDDENEVLDRFEEEVMAKKSKTSPTGGWERVQEIKKSVKCRKTPKQLNVTVNTSQTSSDKRARNNSIVAESPVKESFRKPKEPNVTVNPSQSFSGGRTRKNSILAEPPVKGSHVMGKTESQHLNKSHQKSNSSTLQSPYPSFSNTITAEDLLYLAPTQKINTSPLDTTENPDNFEDLNLTIEDKIMVFEDQLKHNNLKRMFHEIMDSFRNFTSSDVIQKADASVQAKPTTCDQQTEAKVFSNAEIQYHVDTSNAEVQTDAENPIHDEELLANSLDNVVFDTEELISKTKSTNKLNQNSKSFANKSALDAEKTKKPSQNLKSFANKSSFDAEKTKKSSQNLKSFANKTTFDAEKTKNPSQNPKSFANKSFFNNPKPGPSGIKRPIRRNSSNSDEELKPVKKKNRFLREDLSIEFTSTANVENLETCATEGINYDEFIKDVLNHESDSPAVQKQPVWDNCEDIIANVNQNVNKLAKKTSEETESDVIYDSEPIEPGQKRQKLKNKEPELITSTQKSNKMGSGNMLFDDDFDDELGKIEIPSLPKKINIISNIPIQPAEAENDLFSDDDIINATPPLVMDETTDETIRTDLLNITIPPPSNFQDKEILDNNLFSRESDTFINEQSQMQENPVLTTNNRQLSAPLSGVSSRFSRDRNKLINKEPQMQGNPVATTNNLPSYRKLEHSTPLSGLCSVPESVNISPISTKGTENETTIRNKTHETPRRSGCLNIMTSIRNQQSMWNFINTSTQMSPSPKVKPCIACSRLGPNQIVPILNLTKNNLATYTASFTDEVTHLIVAQDINELVTIKFILAVASGIWVLKHEWIVECLAQNRIVPEEPYESLDDKGGTGPKTARLKAKTDPLFKDFKFYCHFNNPSSTREGITTAVNKLGGTIFKRVVDMTEKDGKIPLIIVEDRMSQGDMYERWSELYNIAVVDLEWLSVCIARYRMVGILSYTWYPADSLRKWKYPDYLLYREA